ncbi:hypothetical protein ASA1KI_03320 [Opitutales bacterium ASA1]|nr:hypothetical protein ASA1KI_03320 [Opitutales bacterium ASA1]
MPAGIALLQTAGEDDADHGSGNHTELSDSRHGARKTPIGNGDTHAALNDGGEMHSTSLYGHRTDKATTN